MLLVVPTFHPCLYGEDYLSTLFLTPAPPLPVARAGVVFPGEENSGWMLGTDQEDPPSSSRSPSALPPAALLGCSALHAGLSVHLHAYTPSGAIVDCVPSPLRGQTCGLRKELGVQTSWELMVLVSPFYRETGN